LSPSRATNTPKGAGWASSGNGTAARATPIIPRRRH
jgi:hypothetical protein